MSFSRTGAGLCIYHLLVSSNLNFLHISQWITLPTQSCLVLYSFSANCCYYYYFESLLMVSHWGLRGSKSSQGPGLFSVFWQILKVYTCPFICKSSSLFTNPLGIVRVPQLQFVSLLPSCSMVYFSSQVRSRYLSHFLLSLIFTLLVCRDDKVHYSAGSLFIFFLSLGLVIWLR